MQLPAPQLAQGRLAARPRRLRSGPVQSALRGRGRRARPAGARARARIGAVRRARGARRLSNPAAASGALVNRHRARHLRNWRSAAKCGWRDCTKSGLCPALLQRSCKKATRNDCFAKLLTRGWQTAGHPVSLGKTQQELDILAGVAIRHLRVDGPFRRLAISNRSKVMLKDRWAARVSSNAAAPRIQTQPRGKSIP